MKWYQWNTQTDFNNWHTVLNTQLGYPNEATGTIQYTEAREVEGKWIALVDDEYADGLTLSDLRPPVRVFD